MGKSSILEEDISLIAKLNYSDGLNYFDNLISDFKGKKNFVIQLYKRKQALEIRLAKLFNHFSVGIKYEYINHISISAKSCKILIYLKNRKPITFAFKTADTHEIKTFFEDKLKLKVIY